MLQIGFTQTTNGSLINSDIANDYSIIRTATQW
jgi:hypothetical protein